MVQWTSSFTYNDPKLRLCVHELDKKSVVIREKFYFSRRISNNCLPFVIFYIALTVWKLNFFRKNFRFLCGARRTRLQVHSALCAAACRSKVGWVINHFLQYHRWTFFFHSLFWRFIFYNIHFFLPSIYLSFSNTLAPRLLDGPVNWIIIVHPDSLRRACTVTKCK